LRRPFERVILRVLFAEGLNLANRAAKGLGAFPAAGTGGGAAFGTGATGAAFGTGTTGTTLAGATAAFFLFFSNLDRVAAVLARDRKRGILFGARGGVAANLRGTFADSAAAPAPAPALFGPKRLRISSSVMDGNARRPIDATAAFSRSAFAAALLTFSLLILYLFL
jgi:hypothetical protein